jgi:4-amino-4-deoxy-L-arabinose transferase-like glycosyltransferase
MADHPVTEFQTAWSESDTAIHWEWAGRIRDGDLLSRDAARADTTWMRAIAPIEVWDEWQGGTRAFTKAPLYPYVLAGLRVIARDHLTGVLVGQMAIGLATVALTFLLTDRFFGLGAATVAGLCAALYGPSLLHETLLVRDCLAATTSLLLLWGLARCEPAARGRWFAAGLLFALALLARELTILFAPLVVLWIVERLRSDPAALRAAIACFVAGVVVGLLPLAARNVAVGAPPWAMSALGGHGVVLGHAVDSVPAGFMVPESAKAIFLEAQGRLGPTIRLTLDSYHGDWGRLLYNEAARAAAIVASFEAGDNVSWYYFVNRWPLLRFSLHYDVVLALGVVGLWVARGRATPDARLLVYFLLAAFVGLQYTAVVARYRLVPAAVLIVYAGVAVDWFLQMLRERQWNAAAAGAGATAAVLLVSTSLLPEFSARYRYRATEFIIATRAYMERNEPARAYDEMRAALVTAYAGPTQHVLPEGYLGLAGGLLRVGTTIGRGADAAAVIAQLRRTYDADANLVALQRSAGSIR